MKHHHERRSAFTLIEMLTVIVIVALLATALVTGMKSAQRQAHAALCQARMKNLHQACMNYLTDNNHYPYAGSHEYFEPTDQTYHNHVGWVAWVREDNKDEKNPWAEDNKESHAEDYLHVGWDGEKALRSIRLGSIFKYASRDTSSYFCRQFDGGKKTVRRTYAMNNWFGSRRNQLTKGKEPLDFPNNRRNNKPAPIEPSRMGYIIELNTKETGEHQGEAADAPGKRDPLPYDSVWEYGSDELYGLYHRKVYDMHGHVIFVDGHIESLTDKTDAQGNDYKTRNIKLGEATY